MLDNDYYPFYPKFRDSDIGKNTTDMFIDTLQMSNLYLEGIGGDYDGDTISSRGVYLDEANDELEEFMKTKKNFIGLGGSNIRTVKKDTVQTMYCLTKVLDVDKTKLTKPVFG